MKNIFFPTSIIDGFFENPDEIRNFALSLEYFDDAQNYPGKRTKQISEIDKVLYDTVMCKFMSIFFKREDIGFNGSLTFQLVTKEFGSGWIHRDGSIATGIVYLSQNSNTKIGTSLYQKKNILMDPLMNDNLVERKHASFKNRENDVFHRNEVNNHYKETLAVDGIYNRAIFFDSHFYHAAHDFVGENDDDSRLTLIAFFHNISCGGQPFPIQRMHQQAITIL